MAIATVLLLSVIAFTDGRKDGFRIIHANAISCGPVQPVNGPHSWPKNDEKGSGCTHQTVSAAWLGRVKRNKPHTC